MKALDCIQGSPEWHEARRGVATASCFQAGILAKGKGNAESVGRRNYRIRLALERITGKVADSFTSAAMEQGTEREPMARAAFETKTEIFVDNVGFCLHDELRVGCSPDGLIDKHGGIEIKCPQPASHLEHLKLPEGTCPEEYRAQIQGCMWITGRAWWNFVSFNPEFPPHLQLVIRDVVRDEAYIKQLEFMVRGFLSEVDEEERGILALPIAA